MRPLLSGAAWSFALDRTSDYGFDLYSTLAYRIHELLGSSAKELRDVVAYLRIGLARFFHQPIVRLEQPQRSAAHYLPGLR
jgi:hypothetical protein